MVFISFPSSTTSEEDTLLKKYEKLAKKRRSLEQSVKPEPEIVATSNNKPVEAKDAREVIERLKGKGRLPIITINKKSEFKRKAPQSSAPKQQKLMESREVVSYEDDLFS